MAYVDLNTIHNPATGTIPPASWGDAIRDNFVSLYPEGVVVKRIANQTIPNNTETAIIWTDVRTNVDSMWEGVTNPTRITFLRNGIYLVNLSLQFGKHVGNVDIVKIRDDAANSLFVDFKTGDNSYGNYFNICTIMYIDTASVPWIDAAVQQTSGGDLDIVYDANGTLPNFSAVLLKDLS